MDLSPDGSPAATNSELGPATIADSEPVIAPPPTVFPPVDLTAHPDYDSDDSSIREVARGPVDSGLEDSDGETSDPLDD